MPDGRSTAPSASEPSRAPAARRRLPRGALVAACLGSSLVAARSARAEPDAQVRACIDAATEGQTLRDAGELLAARRRFAACLAPACPAPVRADCARWSDDVAAALPTVVLVAREASGRDATDVRVDEGGEPVAARLDGRPIALDPGTHALRFVHQDGRSTEVRVVVGAGERLRRIEVTLPPTPAAKARPAAEEPPRRSPWPFVGVGVGTAAALGTGLAFVAVAHGQEDQLAARCAPRCADDELGAVRRSIVVANVAFAAALVGGGVLAWLALVPPSPRVVVAPWAGAGGGGAAAALRY